MIPAEVTAITTNNPLVVLALRVSAAHRHLHVSFQGIQTTFYMDFILIWMPPCIQHLCSHPECCRNFWLNRAAHRGTPLFFPTPHTPHSTCFFSFLKEQWTRGKVLYSPDHQSIAISDRKIRNRSPKRSFYYSCFHWKNMSTEVYDEFKIHYTEKH